MNSNNESFDRSKLESNERMPIRHEQSERKQRPFAVQCPLDCGTDDEDLKSIAVLGYN
ncbi:hypothetical protein [Cupriavidus sp. PET2-C1]